MDSEPIRTGEAAPRAVTSHIIFLVAWLAGTTGYFLSILVTTFAQCIRWLPLRRENNPSPSVDITGRTSRRSPIITRPLLSRENIERHVSSPPNSQTCRGVQQSHLPSESMACTTASFSSGDSTLCSPLSDLGDLPPLKNLPPLLLDPQTTDKVQVKKRPMTANFPIKAKNPFKFRRTSTSSAPSPTLAIGEILPVCPSIDQSTTSAVELSSRKPSLIKRLSIKGRRGYATDCPSSAPNSPRQMTWSFRNAAATSKRSASVDIPSQIPDSPVFPSASSHQDSPRRTLFNGFTKRSRTASLSATPARTQPYGPPYNCPLPIPQPRRSGGARRPTTSTKASTHPTCLA